MAATDTLPSDQASTPLSLRLLLVLAALAELVDSLSGLPALFMDHSKIPGPGLGGALILTTIALKPPLALAAIGGALSQRVRLAVYALAGVGICTWLFYLPSMRLSDLAVGFGWTGVQFLADTQLVLPLAVAAIVVAFRTERLTLAIVLACLPTAIRIAGLIAVFIAISIHGF